MPNILVRAENASGEPVVGSNVLVELMASSAGGAVDAGTAIVTTKARFITGVNGEVTFPVVANSLITPPGSFYRVSCGAATRHLVIPAGMTTWNWADEDVNVYFPVPPEYVPGGPGGASYDDTIPDDTLGVADPDAILASIVEMLVILGYSPEDAELVGAGTAAFLGGMLPTEAQNVKDAILNMSVVLALAIANETALGGQVTVFQNAIDALASGKENVGIAAQLISEIVFPQQDDVTLAFSGLITLSFGPDGSSNPSDGVELATTGSGSWDDETLREIGNKVYDTETGKWLVCYSGTSSTDDPAPVNVGIRVSDDGVTFTDHPENPITGAMGGEDPYFAKALNGTAYRDPDGCLLLYCEEKPTAGPDQRGVELWKSEPFLNTGWTYQGRVLDRGTPGEWDANDRTSPVVFHDGTGLVMLFEGRSPGNDDATGIAYADSYGMVWAPNASPVIISGELGSWNAVSVVPDDVVRLGDVWLVTVHGTGGGPYAAGRYFTRDDPGDWDNGSFSESAGNPFWTYSSDVMVVGGDQNRVTVLQWDGGSGYKLVEGDVRKASLDAALVAGVIPDSTGAIPAVDLAGELSPHLDSRYVRRNLTLGGLDLSANRTDAELRAAVGPTGIPSGVTFLRGDGQWVAPPGGGASIPAVLPILGGNSAWGVPGVTLWGPTTGQVWSALGGAAGDIIASYFRVDTAINVTDIACEISTAAGAASMRLGIYSVGQDGQPTGVPLDSGNIAATTTGLKQYTPPAPVYLSPGNYALAITVSNATLGFRTYRYSGPYSFFNPGPGDNSRGSTVINATPSAIGPLLATDVFTGHLLYQNATPAAIPQVLLRWT